MAGHGRISEPGLPRGRVLPILGGLTLLGLFLRLSTVTSRGLWLDEISQVGQFDSSVWDTIRSQMGGTHPPFYHILMHFWTGAFGVSEAALRMLPLIIGVLSIPVAYWAASVLYSRRVGLYAAFVLALSPFHIWYSQEARMYSMLMFFALLSTGSLVLALKRNTPVNWAVYGTFTLMGLFTQYFFLLLMGGQVLYYLFVEVWVRLMKKVKEGSRLSVLRRPSRLIAVVPTFPGWFLTNLVLALAVILWMNWAVFFPPEGDSTMVSSLTSTGLGYGAPPPDLYPRFNDIAVSVVEVLSGFQPPKIAYGLVAMWPLLIYALMIAMGHMKRVLPQTTLLFFSMLSGTLVLWTLGQWQGVVLLSRYLMPMVAAAVLLTGLMLAFVSPRLRATLIAVGLVLSVAAWANQSFDSQSMGKYQNREAFAYVAEHYRPGDVVIYEPFYIDDLANYYLPDHITAHGFPMLDAQGEFADSPSLMGEDLDRVIGPAERVWVVRSFQNVPYIASNAATVDAWFKDNGFSASEHIELNKIELLLMTGDGSRQPDFWTGG